MCTHHHCINRRRLLLAGAASGLLAACGRSPEGGGALVPVEIDRSTSCALDGMLLADYPGPKAQIHYEGRAEPDFFCDTVEMFSIYLNPEQVRAVRGLYVQDMGKANWDAPEGHWIDAHGAWYVAGSRRHGSMGPTIASFAEEADARRFATEFGGKVLRFAEVTPDMVVLDGGALHDQRM
ncbi:nitrous oxide reductase accessory protein NosL [Pseudothauera rhizosphaerae]|uniref:Nitrous oxide reductase accessory protein NosL n=1 Tax=Pseudothauera rhizosphaerae TaxID=2565932 RepID=A0A4S4AMV3_9RHOO|nr:nitrous oxide reductase accessory protein NosL [Pseudothauera rhizosphaerae]THF60858.1 nitrous oxide reductase accessory protein NosL [Pseudothauera rhizosphaerae]